MKQRELFEVPPASPVPSSVPARPAPVARAEPELAPAVADPLAEGERASRRAAVPAEVDRQPPRIAKADERGRVDVPKVWSVSGLTLAIKDLLEPRLARVFVRGEVAGFRGPNVRGHLYFLLKDQHSQVEVRVWQSLARQLRFALKDGMSLLIEGAVSVYEPMGRYSLVAQHLEPEGVGAQALAFEQLKQRLAAEGLIGDRRRPRRPLPLLPRRVGVVTSLSGAALRDFLKVLHRRHPRLSVLVCDARVQGDGAPIELRRAIHWLLRTDVDVLVVTRGGGSSEDLSAFNDEAVVRTMARSTVPVVSAVGHEIDTTLADLVADFRAPTPSAAAEVLAPVLSELELGLATARQRLRRAVEKRILERQHALRACRGGLGDPRRLIAREQLFVSESAERTARVVRTAIRSAREQLAVLAARLQGARPQQRLKERRQRLAHLDGRLLRAMASRLAALRNTQSRWARGLERVSPVPAVRRSRQFLEHRREHLGQLLLRSMELSRHSLVTLGARLDALSPLAVLARGYAIARRADGSVVRRPSDTQLGDQLRLRLSSGGLEVQVVDLIPDSDGTS